ncbi:hypothetical protein MLD52_20930, partial [Puniceicoccaceae bacterium K14]|nr:hypothetical protein [Puniceicoccaceae bacterium K14]
MNKLKAGRSPFWKEQGGQLAAGPQPSPTWATQFLPKWALSRSDSAQIEVHGVRQSHPTLVSQGFGSLALLRFRLEPAKSLFIPLGSNTSKLASAFFVWILSDGKSLRSQEA